MRFGQVGGRGEEPDRCEPVSRGGSEQQSNCTVFLQRPRQPGPLCPGDTQLLETEMQV